MGDPSPAPTYPSTFVLRTAKQNANNNLLSSSGLVVPFCFMGALLVVAQRCLVFWEVRNSTDHDWSTEKWLFVTAMSTNDMSISVSTLIFISSLFFLMTWLLVTKKESEVEHIVSIYPLGVQLSSWSCPTQGIGTRRRKLLQTPRWIPREAIMDVIVTENILAYKVVSILSFRTRRLPHRLPKEPPFDHVASSVHQPREATSAASTEEWTLHQKRTLIQLIPAFSTIDSMTYQQCLSMRDGISRALGLE